MSINKIIGISVIGLFLQACVTVPTPVYRSDAQIADARARIRALENEDYNIERSRRKDAIEDIGKMEMNKAKAIREATKGSKGHTHTFINY